MVADANSLEVGALDQHLVLFEAILNAREVKDQPIRLAEREAAGEGKRVSTLQVDNDSVVEDRSFDIDELFGLRDGRARWR